MRFPSNCTDWSSENEGADRLFVKFQESEDTASRIYYQEDEFWMKWSVETVNEKSAELGVQASDGEPHDRRLQEAGDSVQPVSLIEANRIEFKLEFSHSYYVSALEKDGLLIEVQSAMFAEETRYIFKSE